MNAREYNERDHWLSHAVYLQEQAAMLSTSARQLRDMADRWEADGEPFEQLAAWRAWAVVDAERSARYYALALSSANHADMI